MSELTCYSFHPGHNIHHEEIDDFKQPRMLIDISHVMSRAFLVSFNGEQEYWYHHMPHRLLEALFKSHPEGLEATQDKKFIFVYTGGLILRFSISQEPLTKCIQDSKVHPWITETIKQIYKNNHKKLIERGISA
jgi:hypothetical protein